MSVARLVASQRTDHRIRHAVACRALGVSESWFYRWRNGPPSGIEARRAGLDAAVKRCFEESEGIYGSPRVRVQLRRAGRAVSRKSVMDLCSRRIVGFATSDRHPTAALAQAAIEMAVATRCGDVTGVTFHTDKGTQHTAADFARACKRLGVTRSTGRVGCALDNAAVESFFSTLTHELLHRRDWKIRRQARRDIARWVTDRS